jgi:hypothetical protein
MISHAMHDSSLGSAGCQPAVRGSLPRTSRDFPADVEHNPPGKLPGGAGWQPALPNPINAY